MYEPEVSPNLPTSGQILGALIKLLELKEPALLRSKTARRYFSGDLQNRVKESSKAQIIQAIAAALADSGLMAAPVEVQGEDTAHSVAAVLQWHATAWDRTRAFLRPRMMRVQPHHLALVWEAYVRIVAVDLALRTAAHLHLAGSSSHALELLNWTSASQRGGYLNRKRNEAGLSLEAFAESADVSDNTVDAWIYQGARPSGDHIMAIARALTLKAGYSGWEGGAAELRMLYWVSDIARLLGEKIGEGSVDGIVRRMRDYAAFAHTVIKDRFSDDDRLTLLVDLVNLGAHSPLAGPLLAALAEQETDDEWREDVRWAGSDWAQRALAVNLRVHQSEEDAINKATDGRLFASWDVRNPEAYAHYQRSMQWQVQGKYAEALAEVIRAVELDPLDPANHFTVGSVKGAIGAKRGDAGLVKDGLESCWMAVALDPTWILPWTEIGYILLETGRSREAVKHMLSVKPECGPLDARYHTALGAAHRQLGDFPESLAAFEKALKLDPESLTVVVGTAAAAALAGERAKYKRYYKVAHHLGASGELDQLSDLFARLSKLKGRRATLRQAQRARGGGVTRGFRSEGPPGR